MPTYRIEEASTGRAGCKNKECQDKKEKILKGELRLGTWVDTDNFQSWSWKHWGCVTPKQIANMQEVVGDEKDYTLLDGYDEISTENQEKVRDAVEEGHVADSDWRGDIEVNRPGKTGFRVRMLKTKAGANDESPQKDKRSRSKRAAEESGEEAEPVSKKSKTIKPSKRQGSGNGAGADDAENGPPTSPKEKAAEERKKKAKSSKPAEVKKSANRKSVPAKDDKVDAPTNHKKPSKRKGD
ncbi:hypothetical protein ACO22_00675 [Paracoccidioides brasiliensis]|uniref:Uncharacterized protein n=1 Tax=Paracoccidioides brasiliensis TaxID=121759 RepID=A0A1D2JNU6_PARBR|nr:hypothetical protein ACO22_00675 [Paracoccidioides brasiliensis]ODH49395.1 hypothetical protein GX48_04480 [Paracoccidioides brasiliensis]